MKFRNYLDVDMLKKVHGLDIAITEAIIAPENIKLKNTNLNYLNQKYPNIDFSLGDELSGGYDGKSKRIYIQFNANNTKEEISAMIGHEIIHSIQDKKSKFKYSKISLNQIKEINKLADVFTKSNLSKDYDKYLKALENFTMGSAQEKMAYAYQLVKDRNSDEYKFKTVNDIIDYLQRYNNHPNVITKFVIDKQFKKYIGMYWLIKDNI